MKVYCLGCHVFLVLLLCYKPPLTWLETTRQYRCYEEGCEVHPKRPTLHREEWCTLQRTRSNDPLITLLIHQKGKASHRRSLFFCFQEKYQHAHIQYIIHDTTLCDTTLCDIYLHMSKKSCTFAALDNNNYHE